MPHGWGSCASSSRLHYLPLAGEIGYFRVEAFDGPVLVCIGRMSEEYRIYLMSPCFAVATGIAIRIRVFLIDNIEGILAKSAGYQVSFRIGSHNHTQG